MPRVRYHAVKPQSEQDTYTSSNKPEFLISVGSGRSLVPNSVRILADVRVLSDSTNSASRSTGQRTFDRNLGGHAFIDTVNVNFSNLGSIEENTNYARYVGMDAIASKNEYDMLNSSNACELRGVTQVYGFVPRYNAITYYWNTGYRRRRFFAKTLMLLKQNGFTC